MDETSPSDESPTHLLASRRRHEVEIDFYRSSGPGGQRKNKVATGVRLRHLPTGVIVTATERRSQARNLTLAFQRLNSRLEALDRPVKPRLPTRMPRTTRRKILEAKQRRGRLKATRSHPSWPADE